MVVQLSSVKYKQDWVSYYCPWWRDSLIRQKFAFLTLTRKCNFRNLDVFSLSFDKHCKMLKLLLSYKKHFQAEIICVSDWTVIQAFISTHLDYCNSLFTCLNKASLSCLQSMQNTEARLLTKTNRRTPIIPILASLHGIPVHLRINFTILILTLRAFHGQAPKHIRNLLDPLSPSRTLRSSSPMLVVVPHTHFNTRCRIFQMVAPRLWNALPLSLRCSDSTLFLETSKGIII